MTYQEALVPLIEDAYGDLFKSAERLGDKISYKAAETNRTPLEVLIECATVPGFLAPTIRNRALAPMDAEKPHEESGLDSVEACRTHFNSVKEDLYDAIRSFPAEELLNTIETPWGTFTWRDFIAYAYWNPMYHFGQIAYVQMIHGDTEMGF